MSFLDEIVTELTAGNFWATLALSSVIVFGILFAVYRVFSHDKRQGEKYAVHVTDSGGVFVAGTRKIIALASLYFLWDVWTSPDLERDALYVFYDSIFVAPLEPLYENLTSPLSFVLEGELVRKAFFLAVISLVFWGYDDIYHFSGRRYPTGPFTYREHNVLLRQVMAKKLMQNLNGRMSRKSLIAQNIISQTTADTAVLKLRELLDGQEKPHRFYGRDMIEIDRDLARQFKRYRGTKETKIAFNILSFPLTASYKIMKFWVGILFIILVTFFIGGVLRAVLSSDDAASPELVSILSQIGTNAFLILIANAVGAVFQTIIDLYVIIVHPVVDLLPLVFGAPFSTIEWSIRIGSFEVNLNFITALFYLAFLLCVLFRVRLVDTKINSIIGQSPWALARFLLLCICVLNALFVVTKIGDLGESFSYAESIRDYIQSGRQGSYLDWLFSPFVVERIGAVLDPAVRYVTQTLDALLFMWWVAVFLGISLALEHPQNSVLMANAVPVPDFLQQVDVDTLKVKKEKKAREEIQANRLVIGMLDAVIAHKEKNP